MLTQIQSLTDLKLFDKLFDQMIGYAPKLVGAILLYFIGSFLINRLVKIFGKVMIRKNYDKSLHTFLSSLIKVSLTILLFLSIAGMIGIDITSFAALLAGAGLAIGAALNGSLGNLAGGVMMLVFKPFKVGDLIEAQGAIGTVTEQGIFATTILTSDNKTTIIPNGPLSTGVITNYTTHGNLRVDLSMGIALNQDIDKARKVATEAMLSHPKVLKNPAPEVSVLKVADGMCLLAIRPYTTQVDYWDVNFGVQELVKKAFDVNAIEGPTPTRIIIQK
ncbi:MAG TPA: mechanosensitive ion channel family protein [Chitinophagales bacterium]|jgi:small conductance mechanosensitive channel|nr:mechanosensitive ion channel family protein [Chitinophagales bacterium]MBP6154324.1 mechanosensitive ion channel family protein [Chitinophagales bacterium]HQV79104.1 mechanosensitive ion channel family protein [Chitinophagales bacterium]HQW79772.1 mechanosensitive ion channel family protein [Chitinophagales bacterium]HRB18672.1 mechanosensitive ion channel family protein [Chitinophagales bacterium]